MFVRIFVGVVRFIMRYFWRKSNYFDKWASTAAISGIIFRILGWSDIIEEKLTPTRADNFDELSVAWIFKLSIFVVEARVDRNYNLTLKN